MTLCYLPTPFLFHSSFLSFLSSSLRILKLSIADSASQEGETPPAACASVRMGHRPAPDHLYLGKCTQCGCRYLSSKCFTVCALYTSVCVSVPCPCRLPFPVSFLAPSLMDPHSAIHQGQVYSILVHVSYLYILTLPLPSSHNCCPSPVLLPSPSPVPACLPLSLPILPSGPCSTCFLPCSSLVALLLFLLTLFAAVQIPHFPQSPNLILLL